MNPNSMRYRFLSRVVARAHAWSASRFAIHYGVIFWALPSALIFPLIGGTDGYLSRLLIMLLIFIPGGYFYGLSIRRRVRQRVPPPG